MVKLISGLRDDVLDHFALLDHHHFYDNVSSASSSRQVNGDTPCGRGCGPSPKHRYKVITAKGSSRQMNGNVRDNVTLRLFFSQCMQQYLFLSMKNMCYRVELYRVGIDLLARQKRPLGKSS